MFGLKFNNQAGCRKYLKLIFNIAHFERILNRSEIALSNDQISKNYVEKYHLARVGSPFFLEQNWSQFNKHTIP